MLEMPRLAALLTLAASIVVLAVFHPHLPSLLFAGLALCGVAALPRRDATPRQLAGILVITGSTLAAYAATSMAVFAAAWSISATPFLFGLFRQEADLQPMRVPWLPGFMLTLSALALIAGVMVPSPRLAVAFLMLAVFLRKGLFPLHVWVVGAFERGPLIPVALLFNGHLGANLVSRMELPDLPILGNVALMAAVCTALIGLVERRPRRLLALLSVSQACCILAGLESGTPEGAAGAVAQWLVVSAGTTGLVSVYRILEVRLGEPITGDRFLGLAGQFPRLAVFFAVCGLAMVGLPGTLGFCAEDLLLQGVLESHPLSGLAQPFTAALNAFSLLRLFSVLFLGAHPGRMSSVPDALPRERLALVAIILFLVAGGLAPRWVVTPETTGFIAASKGHREELTRAKTWNHPLPGFVGVGGRAAAR